MGKVASAIGKVFEVVGFVLQFTPFAPIGRALMIGGAILEGIGAATMKRPDMDMKDIGSGQHITNTRNTNEVVPVVYGTCRVGGNWIWVNTDGTDNKYLRIVMTLSEGPIDSVSAIYLNGEELSTTPQANLVSWAYTTGEEIQTIPTIVSDYGYTDNTPWTSLLCVALTYDREKWQGVPNITALVKGRVIYDPRIPGDVFSNNPALVALDFIRNPRYGLGISDDRIDFDSFSAAATYCETKGYTFDGILSSAKRWNSLAEILAHFNASLVRGRDGIFRIKIKDLYNETSVMSITNEDIVAGSFSFSQPSLQDIPNTIKVTFLDQDLNYQANSIVVEDTASVSVQPVRTQEIQLTGANREQAIKIANYLLKRNKLNRTCSVTVSSRGLPLEQGDIISLTYDDFGISEQLFRITSISYNNDDTVTLTLLEEDYSLYDDATTVSIPTYPSTTLPDPYETPPPVSNLLITEETYQQKDGTWTTRLKITFNEPVYAFNDHYEIWIQENLGTVQTGNFIHVANIEASSPGVYVEYFYENTKEGYTYNVKVITVSSWGVKSAEILSSIITEGKDYPPADVTFITSSCYFSSNIRLEWQPNTEIKDLDYYEIRTDTNFGNDIGLVAKTKETILELPGLSWNSSRTWTFYIKAKDTSGNYSLNYDYITVTNSTPLPPSFTVDVNYRAINISWSPVGDGDIIRYEIDINGNIINAGLANNYIYYGNPGIIYNISIRAVDICGAGSWATYTSVTTTDIDVTQTPDGYNLIQNWSFEDGSDGLLNWTASNIDIVLINDGIYGNRAAQNSSTSVEGILESNKIPIDNTNGTYIAEVYLRSISSTTSSSGTAVAYLEFYNASGVILSEVTIGSIGTADFSWNLLRLPFGYNQTVTIPSDTTHVSLKISLNSGPGDGQFQVQSPKIREVIESAWIRDAAIQTAHIADAAITNAKISGIIKSDLIQPDGNPAWKIDKNGSAEFHGITIYDPYGNPIMTTDSVLWDKISGTGKPEDNATVGAQAGVNLKDASGNTADDIIHPGNPVTETNADNFITDGAIYGNKLNVKSLIRLDEGGKLIIGNDNIIIDSVSNDIIVTGDGGPDTNDYVQLYNGDITFYYYNGTGHEFYKSLKRIETGIANNGETVYLPGIWKSTPQIILTPYLLQSFNPSYSDRPQYFNLVVENLTEYEPNKYSFVPRCLLVVDPGNFTFTVNVTITPGNSYTYDNPDISAPAGATITINYDLYLSNAIVDTIGYYNPYEGPIYYDAVIGYYTDYSVTLTLYVNGTAISSKTHTLPNQLYKSWSASTSISGNYTGTINNIGLAVSNATNTGTVDIDPIDTTGVILDKCIYKTAVVNSNSFTTVSEGTVTWIAIGG